MHFALKCCPRCPTHVYLPTKTTCIQVDRFPPSSSRWFFSMCPFPPSHMDAITVCCNVGVAAMSLQRTAEITRSSLHDVVHASVTNTLVFPSPKWFFLWGSSHPEFPQFCTFSSALSVLHFHVSLMAA